jgi:hypothetical protein
MKNPIAIGAYATIQYRDETNPIENYYFSFGDAGFDYENDEGQDWGEDSYGMPDWDIFYYCNGGEEELKSLMLDGNNDFKVLSYKLIYEMESV